jgi:hypothetical protein
MQKKANVYMNDSVHPQQDLVISGQVENFAAIHPQHISLRGQAGDSITGTVSIIPDKKYPFKILEAKAQSGKNISVQLNEIKNANGAAYQLKIENISQDSGRYYDTVVLKTDSKIKPELDVKVYGYLRERKSE